MKQINSNIPRFAEQQLQLLCLLQWPGWVPKNCHPNSLPSWNHSKCICFLFGFRCTLHRPAVSQRPQQDKRLLYLIPGEFECMLQYFIFRSASVDYYSMNKIFLQIRDKMKALANCSLSSKWVFPLLSSIKIKFHACMLLVR